MYDVKTADLLNLPLGESTLPCRDLKQCESVKTLAYRIPKLHPELKIKFSCSIDCTSRAITIVKSPC